MPIKPVDRKKSKTKEEIARNMGAIKSTNTLIEVQLRSRLHREGLRFRKNYRQLIGRPDIVFVAAKVVVFIDGDYWHGRRLREEGMTYLDNYFQDHQKAYWSKKLMRNVARDEDVTKALKNAGWMVLRFWESDVKRDMDSTVKTILSVVRSR